MLTEMPDSVYAETTRGIAWLKWIVVIAKITATTRIIY